MKSLVVSLLFVLSSVLFADSFEVKTGEGYKVPTRSVDGVFNSRYESNFPYVCYEKRVKVVIDGRMYLTYKGCKRYNSSCKRLGRAHFGKYPNDYKAAQALDRCFNARPRFVD